MPTRTPTHKKKTPKLTANSRHAGLRDRMHIPAPPIDVDALADEVEGKECGSINPHSDDEIELDELEQDDDGEIKESELDQMNANPRMPGE